MIFLIGCPFKILNLVLSPFMIFLIGFVGGKKSIAEKKNIFYTRNWIAWVPFMTKPYFQDGIMYSTTLSVKLTDISFYHFTKHFFINKIQENWKYWMKFKKLKSIEFFIKIQTGYLYSQTGYLYSQTSQKERIYRKINA